MELLFNNFRAYIHTALAVRRNVLAFEYCFTQIYCREVIVDILSLRCELIDVIINCAGKGEVTVNAFEIAEDAPHMFQLSAYKAPNPSQVSIYVFL